MRFLTYLFTFLVLTLSCLPCADGQDVNTEIGNAQFSLQDTHPVHDHPADACSPFCICTCCSVSFVYHYTTVALSLPASSPNYSFFYGSTLHEISLPIWQPPQLV